MAHLTAHDLASRTMKKGWVKSSEDDEDEGPKAERKSYENSATTVARGLNKVSRATGLPYNKGAVSVQTHADMLEAQNISDTVPRRRRKSPLYDKDEED